MRTVGKHYRFYLHAARPATDTGRVVVQGCRVTVEQPAVEMWPRRELEQARGEK